MAGSKLPYALFLELLLLLNAAVFYVPYAASQGDANAQLMYAAFAPTCHQLTSRSNCLFVSQDKKYSFGDCLQSDKLLYTRANEVEQGGEAGYKLPVCSRDVGDVAVVVGRLRPVATRHSINVTKFGDVLRGAYFHVRHAWVIFSRGARDGHLLSFNQRRSLVPASRERRQPVRDVP